MSQQKLINNGEERRSMSNLTKKQIEEAQIRKSLKQQGLIPNVAFNHSQNEVLAQSNERYNKQLKDYQN